MPLRDHMDSYFLSETLKYTMESTLNPTQSHPPDPIPVCRWFEPQRTRRLGHSGSSAYGAVGRDGMRRRYVYLAHAAALGAPPMLGLADKHRFVFNTEAHLLPIVAGADRSASAERVKARAFPSDLELHRTSATGARSCRVGARDWCGVPAYTALRAN
jgi:hypothetical protein